MVATGSKPVDTCCQEATAASDHRNSFRRRGGVWLPSACPLGERDAGATVAQVRPDLYCIQTHWPDWLKPNLPPDYVKAYKPFMEQVRSQGLQTALMIQADIGSKKEIIRDRAWVEAFERACLAAGVHSTTVYEYFLGGYIYHEPPRIAEVRRRGDQIDLHFTKRLDPTSPGDPARYKLSGARMLAVTLDGNIVHLKIAGESMSAGARLTVSAIADAPDRRLIPGDPVHTLATQTVGVPSGENR